MLEQIKINYQINDIGNSCCKNLVGVESKENWAIGHRAETLPKKEFRLCLSKFYECFKVLTKGLWKLGENFLGVLTMDSSKKRLEQSQALIDNF